MPLMSPLRLEGSPLKSGATMMESKGRSVKVSSKIISRRHSGMIMVEAMKTVIMREVR